MGKFEAEPVSLRVGASCSCRIDVGRCPGCNHMRYERGLRKGRARRPQLLNRRPRSPSLRTGGGCGRRYPTRAVIRRTRRNGTNGAYARHIRPSGGSRRASDFLSLTTTSPCSCGCAVGSVFGFLKCWIDKVTVVLGRRRTLSKREKKIGGGLARVRPSSISIDSEARRSQRS